jgi:hypothetical protein
VANCTNKGMTMANDPDPWNEAMTAARMDRGVGEVHMTDDNGQVAAVAFIINPALRDVVAQALFGRMKAMPRDCPSQHHCFDVHA